MLRFALPVLIALTAASLLQGGRAEALLGKVGEGAPAVDLGRSEKVENDRMWFEYAYPHEAGAIPALRAALDKDMAASRAELESETQEAMADARANDYPFRAHSLLMHWEVAAQTPGWLSLSLVIDTYSGGAHGNHGFKALLWDKKANAERKLVDLFTSPEALRAAMQPEFCRLLDAERAERRGEPVKPDDMFGECIDPLEGAIVPQSIDGDAFDGFTVLVAPYMAGPYAEGSYDVKLPMTAKMLAAVKPEHRAAFTVPRL